MSRIEQAVAALAARLQSRSEWLAVAESCTGGLIAKTLTDAPGSSRWFERGYVVYSNQAKQDLLGVPAVTLARHGAVSEAVVRALASGVMARAPVQWSLAVSGIAGPGGGSPDKPVGTVWIAWAGHSGVTACHYVFAGDRGAVRSQALDAALQGLLERLDAAG